MKRLSQAGFLTPALLGVMIAFGIIATAVGTVVLNNFFIVGNNVNRQQALNIAEAGANYYLWHLNHNPTDYRDGTGKGNNSDPAPDPNLGYGPFVHDYINADGSVSGTYTLYIKPPVNTSSSITVRSIGKVKGTNAIRTIDTVMGPTSFANFAVLSDSALWFGKDETANGPVHSNQGVRMDGANSDTVSSARTTYVPPNQLGGDGSAKPGVWCSPSVTSPVSCNNRSKASWNYPVTSIDFNQVSNSLCTMKKLAFANDNATAPYVNSSSACSQTPNNRTSAYLPRRSSSSFSISRGYLVELNSNNTYNLYQVNGENDRAANYTSALSLSNVANNITVPSNGVIYAEDNVWVRTAGQYNGRVTISAGRLSDSNDANIIIADDVIYRAKDGSNVIGLISEGDTLIAPYAPPATGSFTFEVNAAILSQNGVVGYPQTYRSDNDRCTRGWTSSNQRLNFYGSIATRQNWTWSWLLGGNNCGDAVYSNDYGSYIAGFRYSTSTYDYNLLSTPPPSFPTTGGFNVLSWREVLTRP